MKTNKIFKKSTLMMALAMLLTFSYSSLIANSPAKATKSIVEIAVSNDNFSILVEALSKAELVEALSADGPFTVFAPTNEAFEALFAELNVDGISDLTKDQLTPILLYHVVNGNVVSSDVKTGKVETLNTNAELKVKKSSKGVMLDSNSKVVSADITATNGVIHVIDAVLVPTDKRETAKLSSGSCD